MGMLDDIEKHRKGPGFLKRIWSGIGELGNLIFAWADSQPSVRRWVVLSAVAWILYLILQAGFILTQDWSDGRVPPIKDDVEIVKGKMGRVDERLKRLEKLHGIKNTLGVKR